MSKKHIKKPIAFSVVILILISLSISASAREKKNKPFRIFTRRPKVGLVLSGGGAKGIAHIGVLKVIERAGVHIDFITGTSMGSIVGGLYASGYTAAMLEKIVLTADWDDLLEDKVSRRSVSIDEKNDHDKYLGSLQIKKGGIQLPTGYKQGQKLTSLLSCLTLPVQDITDFDKLPIPFRCVATDIVTGNAYVLKSGYLPDALRASMAIPSIFTPIEIDNHLLVDGGIVRNLPVSDVREMGADLIIAVDVSAPLYKKSELDSIINILDQVVSFLGARNTKKQQFLADILVLPDIKRFTASEFKRGAELIAVGETAGNLILPELATLAEAQKKFPGEEQKIQPIKSIKKLKITKIEIHGLKHVSRNLVLGKLLVYPPDRLTPEELMDAVARVYASGFFDRVTYQIQPDESAYGGSTLILSVVEASGIFLKLGFSYDTDMNAAVLGNITIRNLAGEGSRFAIDVRLSEFPGILASYFIHTGIRRPGIGFGAKIHFDRFYIYTYQLGNVQSVYDYYNTGADLVIQAIVFNSTALGIGVQKDLTFIRSQIAPSDPLKDNTEALNYYAYLMFDNLDDTLYPTSGVQFYGEVKYITNHLTMLNYSDKFPNFFKYTGKLKGYIPLYPKLVSLYIGCTLSYINAHEPYYIYPDILSSTGWSIYRNSIPFIYENYMGGLYEYTNNCFPFTGLNFVQIYGKQMIVGDVGLQAEVWKDIYLILHGSVGRVKSKFENLFRKRNLVWDQAYGVIIPRYEHLKNDLIYGYGITISYNSIIGPIEATLMRGSESNKFLFHFNIGYRI
jgi:NTE family protein